MVKENLSSWLTKVVRRDQGKAVLGADATV